MKLLSYRWNGRDSWGALRDGRIHDAGGIAADLQAWLAAGQPDLASLPAGPALADVDLLPVIPRPAMIICAALNYRDDDAPATAEGHPVLFLRLASSQIGHGADLIAPAVSDRLDYEGELAVIIGRPGRHIRRAGAMAHVAGYACYNDGSVRDWQKHSHQFTAGKNFAGTGAFGPWMVTADQIPDPAALSMEVRVNGVVKQATRMARMIHDIPALIAYVSTFSPLAAGDVIVTGTCRGFGATRSPPEFLSPGDVVEVEIPGVGLLRNRVRGEEIPDFE